MDDVEYDFYIVIALPTQILIFWPDVGIGKKVNQTLTIFNKGWKRIYILEWIIYPLYRTTSGVQICEEEIGILSTPPYSVLFHGIKSSRQTFKSNR